MLKLSRSFRALFVSLASAIMLIAGLAIQFVLSKFEPTVEFAVAEVCRIGHSLKTGVYSFAVKVSGKVVSACDGFVSMRRSLDASALA